MAGGAIGEFATVGAVGDSDAALIEMVKGRLARNVKRLRGKKNQDEIETIDKSTLSQIENGKANPELETLAALASGLNADISALFALDAPHPVPHGPTQIEVTEAVRDALLQVVGEIGAGLIKRQTISKAAKPRRQTSDPGDRKTGSG